MNRRRIAALAVEGAVVLGLVGLALWLRWPALSTAGFHNEDAAGITYNADLLRRGLTPLVDNLEYKAPGSFFASWFLWGLFGRSLVVLQRFMVFWSIVATLGIYAGGRLLYGRRSAAIAALLYVVCSPITDSIDINYGAWMIAPYIWSTVFVIAGQKRGHWGFTVAGGATLAVAGLFKRQAAVLFPLFVLILLLPANRVERPEGWAPAARRRDLIALGAGLAAGFLPAFIFYLARGGLGDFVGHYFFSKAGWSYVKSELTFSDQLDRVQDGFLGLWAFMALPALLAAMTAAAVRPVRGFTLRGVLLGGHFWLSFLGAALGFRFFKGYYLQCLPAAVWLAAHPEGPLRRWFARESWPAGLWERAGRAALIGCIVLATVPAGLRGLDELGKIRKRRERPRDGQAQTVARVIRDNSDPGDGIWVWGRWAWPVYFHADRIAPTRYYKVLGVLTNTLTNTWKRAGQKTRFSSKGPWREVIAELKAGAPSFIVLSRNESYSKFRALRDLLRTDYRRVSGIPGGMFVLYRHKGHALPKPPRRRRPRRRGRKAR